MTYSYTFRYQTRSGHENWPGLGGSFESLVDAIMAAQKAWDEENAKVLYDPDTDWTGVTASVFDEETKKVLITITKNGHMRAHSEEAKRARKEAWDESLSISWHATPPEDRWLFFGIKPEDVKPRPVGAETGQLVIVPRSNNVDQAPDADWQALGTSGPAGTVADWTTYAKKHGLRLTMRKRTVQGQEGLLDFTDPVRCTPFIAGYVGARDLDQVWDNPIFEMRARLIVGPVGGQRTRDLLGSWTASLKKHKIAKNDWLSVGRSVFKWRVDPKRREHKWTPGDYYDLCDGCCNEFVCLPRSPVWRALVSGGKLLCRSCRLAIVESAPLL